MHHFLVLESRFSFKEKREYDIQKIFLISTSRKYGLLEIFLRKTLTFFRYLWLSTLRYEDISEELYFPKNSIFQSIKII